MILHGPGSEHGTRTLDGFTLAGRCLSCPLVFTSRGQTVKEARQAMKRKAADHRGFVAAAGPGWTEVGA